MSRSWRRGVAAGGALLLLLGATAVTAGWFWLRSSLPPTAGSVDVPGLEAPVTVRSDSFAVPHVSAATEEDLYRAQGWLHAAHRLWQMELLRRTARGRLSEIFGEPTLQADRLLRTLDLWGAAGRSADAMDPGARRAAEAYADGVNAWIREHERTLPPEFLLLGIEPEPWSPRASAAVGKVMALDLSAWRRELSRFHAYRTLPAGKYDVVRPRYPEWGPTILGLSEWGSGSVQADGPVLAAAEPASPGGIRTPHREPDGATSAGMSATAGAEAADEVSWEDLRWLEGEGFRASNGWVLAGERTRTGHPLVANDMHLGLSAPAIWYVMGLRARASGHRVAGLTLPGAPGVVVGFNRRIAWTFTNGMVDDMDFTVETVDLDGSAYRTPGGWRDFAVRPETIRVRGRAESVVHPVRETVRGPVLSDVLPDLGATLSAMWLASGPTTELEGLTAMNRATTPDAFQRAVGSFDSPQQNVLWAAVDGTLGYRLSGRVPRRPGWSGELPVASRVVGRGWPGTWPLDSMPAAVLPPSVAARRGFLAGANNLQAPGLFGTLGVDYPIPFRARRIEDVLEGTREASPEDMLALQRDVRSLLADRLVDRAVRAARRAGRDSAATLLEGWDRRVTREARGAGLFYAWAYRLRSLVAADEYRETREWGYFPMAALLRIEEADGDAGWVDDVTTDSVETLEGLEERAIRDAVAATGLRPWGRLHRERHSHPLGRVGWLERIFGFHVGPRPSPGAPRTVRPDDYRRWRSLDSASWRPPWTGDYGPSERLVVSVEPDLPSAGVLLPTGQSGLPFSPHYRDMSRRWRDGGDLVPLSLDSAEVERGTVDRLELVPAPAGGTEGRETPSR